MNKQEVLAELETIPTEGLQQAAFRAVVRAQVYFTGRTHELMLDYGTKAQGAILRAGGREGVMSDAVEGFALQADLMRMWGDTWNEWQAEFQQMRREAGWIAFGVQALSHERLMVSTPLSASQTSPQIAEGTQFMGMRLEEATVVDGVYDPMLRILLEIAANYVYGDGINLSDRVWRIDREARDGINAIIINGIANQRSAWDMAKDLEQFLGAGQDCPRWTSSRLYRTSKTEIAQGNPRGLLSGNDCDGRGVSYKALRLARTEIQKMHALATDRMMAMQPWVEKEKINLSAAHPETDECDDVVAEGEKGEGIYDVGTIELPLHPNCLCYKTAIMTDRAEFAQKMNAWLKGEPWAEMDAYAADLGVDLNTSLMPAALTLAVWLFGNALKDWLK